jgi:tetratricopeptide (TPR) repeat protein
VWSFWRQLGHHYEGCRWLRAVLERGPVDAPARAPALAGLATLAFDLGEREEVRRSAEEAVRLAEASGDHRSAGFALLRLANVAEPGGGEPLNARALAHFRAAGFGWGVGAALSNRGLAALRRGDVAAAQPPFEEALAESRRIGSPGSEMSCLFYLVMTAYHAGQLARALALLDEADPVSQLGSYLFVWTNGQARGWVLLEKGDVRGAEAMFRAAVRDEVSVPRLRGRPPFATGGSPLYWLGAALLRRGEVERGVRLMAAGHPEAQQAEPGFGLGPGRRRVDALLAEAKAELPPDRFAALWAEGEAMTRDQATAYALEEPEPV